MGADRKKQGGEDHILSWGPKAPEQNKILGGKSATLIRKESRGTLFLARRWEQSPSGAARPCAHTNKARNCKLPVCEVNGTGIISQYNCLKKEWKGEYKEWTACYIVKVSCGRPQQIITANHRELCGVLNFK